MRLAQLTLAAIAAPLLACGPQITFSEHIAPILQAKCQSCHRPGHMAPMSLLTYQEVRPLAPVIRASIAIGNMPPFYAAGPPGYYKDDIRLTEAERSRIFDWADAGAPEGDPALLPEPIEWVDSEWPLGEPDLVVHLPRHSPPPVLKDHEITLVSEYEFPEDLWVRAMHLKTESRQVIHHSTQFMWSSTVERPPGGKTLEHFFPAFPLFTWFPGLTIEPLPPGQAFMLPKATRIATRTHFGPTRDRVSEEMELGLYFADGTINNVQKNLGFIISDLRIPPGEANYTRSARKSFEEAAYVSHFRVHMHLRGKSSKVIFHYPDGSSETVFDLPRYRFSWQRYYYLAEPMPVPAGTVAEVFGVWDNSEDNPLNPDPTVWCSYGARTVDEMFGVSVFYSPQEKLAEPAQVKAGRRLNPPSDDVTEPSSSTQL